MMDLRSTLEKDSIELDQKNLFDDSKKVMHEHLQKIEKTQWSIANENVWASSTKEHYTTIKDTLNEDIRPSDSTVIGDRASDVNQSAGYPYVSFNGADGFPTWVNNATSEIYSYAKKVDQRVLRWLETRDENRPDNSDLSLRADDLINQENLEDHSSNHFRYNGDHYDNNKAIATLKDSAPFQQPGTSQAEYDNGKDTYLVPRQEKAKRKQQLTNLSNIDRDNNGHGHTVHELGTSTYVDRDVRIPGCDSLATPKPKVKQFSKRKIIIVIVVMLLLLVAVASAVAVLLNSNQTEDPPVCDNEDECQSKCLKYPDVANGHVSSTEELLPSSTVNISCNQGFRIDETATAVCLDSGSWSHVATCEPVDCGKYLPPDHVFIPEPGQDTSFNTSIRLKCNTGFQLAKQSDSFVWCDEDGHWSGNPKCCENLVALSIEPTFFLIGETAKLTCEFRNISEWRKVLFKREILNKDSVTIASIEDKIGSYKQNTIKDNIKITDGSFTHNSVKVSITFETVQCSDAFEIPGDINFICDVQSDNFQNFRDERSIRIQGKPTDPVLTLSPYVLEREDMRKSIFVCEMLFAEPNGHVIIESDYGGEYTTLLSSANGEYETDVAWIDDVKTKLTNCWYRMVVNFGLKSVSMKWHRKHIRCIAKPSNSSFDQTISVSDNGVVKVLSEKICQGQDVVSYPYNCGLYVTCDKSDSYNSVLNVIPCDNDYCTRSNGVGCSQCYLGGGCSVTDIYFKDGGSNEVGSALTIVCIVKILKTLRI